MLVHLQPLFVWALFATPFLLGFTLWTDVIDHVSRAKARLLSQYQSSPKLVALVGELGAVAAEVETALFQVGLQTSIDSAAGTWLDWIGSIVKEPRGSLADATYRVMIRARILANRTRGTTEDVNAVLKAWNAGVFPTVNVFVDSFPAGLDLQITSPLLDTTEKVWRLWSLLKSTRAGGVALMLRYQTVITANSLIASDAAMVANVAQGLSDEATPLVGGIAGGAIRC
jgi:hypothetical protein